MAKKKFTAILLAAVMAFAVCAFTGCNSGDDEFTEKIDPTRTQIYVFNFYGGFRADWLVSVKKQFEEMYKDYEGVDENGEKNGKVGVQVLMDNRKEYFSTGATNIRGGTNEVYFTEYMYYHAPHAGNAFLDITDWLVEPLSEFGETRSIADKMSKEQRAYYSDDGTATGENDDGTYTVANDTRKYYAVPHYEAYEGIVYNKDLWLERGFYFSESHKNEGLYYKFTNDLTDLTAGPDGKHGTADDGLPATYADFLDMCTYIYQNGVTPFVWTGEHYGGYIGGLYNALVTDYEGAEMRLNYTVNGTASTLVDKDGNALSDQTITPQTAYKLANMKGRREALKLVEKIVHTSEWQAEGSFNTAVSHHDAQAKFLSSGYDGNAPIAMLLDGTWWEGEATETFQEVADRYPGAKDKNERSFGWMPMPKADPSKVGEGQTYFDTVQGMTFVKATLAENKKDLVKKFIRFVYSDKMLSEFTRITSAIKALDYEVTDADKAKMTPFALDLWTQREAAADIIYPISDTPLFANNQADFDRESLMGVRINGSDYAYCANALHEIPTLTAQAAFEGMLDYQRNSWFGKLKK